MVPATGVGPYYLAQADTHDVGAEGPRRRLGFKKQREVLALFMSRVKDGSALPAPLLVLSQFGELCDDPLPRDSGDGLRLPIAPSPIPPLNRPKIDQSFSKLRNPG